MCARFSLTSPIEAIRQLFTVPQQFSLTASYNIAPTTQILAIRNQNSSRRGTNAFWPQWGLIPSWSKSSTMGTGLINARLETIQEKPSFRSAFKTQRCLIPTNGYFEWKTEEDGAKQPYYIYARNTPLFAFAGLWGTWIAEDGRPVESCSLITQPAKKNLKAIHHRMPLTVCKDAFESWLAGSDAASVPSETQQEDFVFHPIGQAIGNVKANGPDLISEIRPPIIWRQGKLF